MRRALVLVACLCLAGCGFQLRGSAQLPYESLYLDVPSDSELGAHLDRTLRGAQSARLAETPTGAAAIFSPTLETRERRVLSFNSAGRVRELQLVYRYNFRVHDAGGVDLIPPATLVATRDLTYDDARMLAKEQEEDLLWRDMRNDLVQQVTRRLAGRIPRNGAAAGAPAADGER